LADSLSIEDLDLNLIKSHPFTKEITDDESIKFELNDEQIAEILDNNSENVEQMAVAISKVNYSRYIEKKSEGKIKISYDNSDGDYEIGSYDSPLEEFETKVYTDGEVIDKGVFYEGGIFEKSRKINIRNSSYSIVVDYNGKKPLASVVRVMENSMLLMAVEEANNIIQGINLSHEAIIDKNPKIYKRRVH